MNQQQVTENKQEHKLHSASALVKANEHVHKQDHPLMQAQNLIGNHGVLQRYGYPVIQAKLKIGEPNDVYEQEADRMADAVMRMPDPQVQRKSPWNEDEEDPIQMKPVVGESTTLVQRKSPWNEDEEDPIQMKPADGESITLVQRKSPWNEDEEDPIQMKSTSNQTAKVPSNIAKNIHALRGGGESLPMPIRNFFEPRFGYDFSKVRIHANNNADDSAKSIHAEAFTTGFDIAFASGKYRPHSQDGIKLLAHELTHVLQQGSTPSLQGNHIQRWSGSDHKAITIKASSVIPQYYLDATLLKSLYSYVGAMDLRMRRIARVAIPGIKHYAVKWHPLARVLKIKPPDILPEGPEHGEGLNYQSPDVEKNRNLNMEYQNRYLDKSVEHFIDYRKLLKDLQMKKTSGVANKLYPLAIKISERLGDALHIAQDRGSHWEGVKNKGHKDPRPEEKYYCDDPSKNEDGYKNSIANSKEVLSDFFQRTYGKF
jgi:hypothetical protein